MAGYTISSVTAEGIRISVENESGVEISDVNIIYTDGSASTKVLSTNETFRITIFPQLESGLSLEYLDSDQKIHRHPISIYIEPGYWGSVSIDIHPKHKIQVQNNIIIM